MKFDISKFDYWYNKFLSSPQRWCSEPQSDDLLLKLRGFRHQIAISKYTDIERKISLLWPNEEENILFQYLDRVFNFSEEVIQNVLAHPSALSWLGHLEQLITYDKEHFPKEQIDIFACLYATISFLSRKPVCIEDLSLPKRFTLPYLDIGIELPKTTYFKLLVVERSDSWNLIFFENQIKKIHITMLSNGHCSYATFDSQWKLRQAPLIENTNQIKLNFIDKNFQTLFPMVIGSNTPFESNLWQAKLKDSFRLISEYWPEMYNEITTNLVAIVPLSSGQTNEEASGAHSTAIHVISTSLVKEPYLSGLIIHEHRHDVLSMLMFLEDIFYEGQKDILMYSPWRNDPRPRHGVFHAIFVSTAVCEYYLRLVQCALEEVDFTIDELLNSLGVLVINIYIGIQEIRHTTMFTVFGDSLMRCLEVEAERLFQEAHRLETFAKSHACEQVFSHYRTWCKRWKRVAFSSIEEILKLFSA